MIHYHYFNISDKKGFSLVEVLLSLGLFAMIATVLAGVFLSGEENSALISNRNRAVFLSHQGVEATRSIRDEDYTNLINGTYGLDASGGTWVFNGSSDLNGIYTRDITISDYDTDVKEVSSRVTWNQNAQRTGEVVTTSLLSFWQEVVSVIGDWMTPGPGGSIDTGGNTNGAKVDTTSTHAYLVTNTTFYTFDITDPLNPLLLDTLAVAGTLRDVVVSGGYAYVSSTQNNAEIAVIDISDPSNVFLEDSINLSGNQNMRGLTIWGTTLFATRDRSSSEFTILDISDPTSVSVTSTLNLSNRYRDVYVRGTYAYLAGDPNSEDLVVVDISDLNSPFVEGVYDVTGNDNGTTVTGYGSVMFYGRDNGDVLVIDISDPTSLALFSSFSAGSAVRDIAANSSLEYIFVVGDTNNQELQIYDVSSLGVPILVGFYDSLGQDFNGVSYVASGDFVVIAGESNTEELTIVIPQ